MRRLMVWGAVILLCAVPVGAAEPQEKTLHDYWDAAFMAGNKHGYSHTTVRQVERDGKKLLRAAVELNLTFKRFNATAQVRVETGTEETEAGKVTAVHMRQFLDNNQQLLLTGTVEDGNVLHVKSEDGRIDRKVRWDDQVVGLARQEDLFRERKAKPGDQWSYLSYEPVINSVVTVRVTVKGEEDVEVLGVRRRGLRAEVKPDKVMAANGSVDLPARVVWLDKDYQPLRSQTEVPGLGQLVLVRTTKAAATAQGAAPLATDIGLKSLIRLARPLPPRPRSAVYRITVKGDEDAGSAFAADDNQAVKNAKGDTFELHVRPRTAPPAAANPGLVEEEFLKSCYYLNSDDVRVRRFAAEAVGQETDAWKKAQRVERWVFHNVSLDNSAPFAPSDRVAQTLRGDCRHKALLAAAMCRAVGVPSRTAVGLVYAEDRKGPFLAFHMWVEVYVNGDWLGLDGTRGLGFLSADHLKISDHSWHDTQSMTPLLPVVRVLDRLRVEVLGASEKE